MKKIIFLTLLTVMFAGSAQGVLIFEAPMDANAVDIVGGATPSPFPAGTNVFGTPAVAGNALQVNSSDQPGVEYAGTTASTGDFSVSLWLGNDTGAPDWSCIVMADGPIALPWAGVPNWNLMKQTGSMIRFALGPGTGVITVNYVLGGPGFKHIVATYDTVNGMRLYINGALVGSSPADGYTPTPYERWSVGVGLSEDEAASPGSTKRYPGSYDEVKIFDHGLDQAEVTALYLEGSPPVIDVQPVGQNVNVGEEATFSVTATNPNTGDSTGLEYAWYKQGSPTVLSTANSYTDPDVQLADEGIYYCVVKITSNGNEIETNHVELTATAPLPPQKILHAPMDGNADDIAGDPSPYVADPSGTPVFGTPAVDGQALQLSEPNQPGVKYSDVTLNTGMFSVAFWVGADSANAVPWTDLIVINFNVGGQVVIGCADTVERLYYGIDFPAAGLKAGTIPYVGMAASGFRHIVCTYDGVDKKVYVDGTLKHSLIDINEPMPNSSDLSVGGTSGAGDTQLYTGSVDDVRLYNYALEATHVVYLYTGEPVCDRPDYDVTGDCKVTLEDLSAVAGEWLEDGLSTYPEL